ncbi:TPA: 3'-5' exonuclease [Vibrio parahaemolyticus]|nr:3'-5' exonuclease [Vibrio parahaemolyticus]
MIYDPLAQILVADVETTGFSSRSDEILSLAIVDGHGKVVFDELFKPEHKTSWLEAARVNGITPNMVKNAPKFADHKKRLRAIFSGKTVLFYNSSFDERFLTDELENAADIFCVMNAFTEYYREPNSKRGGKWVHKKLEFAMNHFKLRFKGDPHTAKADALAALDVFLKLAEVGRENIKKAWGNGLDKRGKADYVILDTLAYVNLSKGNVIGVIKNQHLDDCIKLIKADYPDHSKVLLCRKPSDCVIQPIYVND